MFKCLSCSSITSHNTGNIARDADKLSVVKCENCGLVQLYPLPSVEEDANYYNGDFQSKSVNLDMEMKLVLEKAKPDATRRIEFLNKLTNNKTKDISILEIGSGYGVFLDQAQQNGYDIEGIEISSARRAISSNISTVPVNDYNLIKDNLNSYTSKQYDFIAMFHVLEHIQSPLSFLENLKTPLERNGGGYLIVEVPNVDDYLINICPSYSDFYWQRAHLIYFSPYALKNMLTKAGFNVVNIEGVQRYSIENAMNWLTLGKPQIEKPAYSCRNELKWLDDFYRKHLEENLICDTLMAVAKI